MRNPLTRVNIQTRRNIAFGMMLAVVTLGSTRSDADSTELPPDLIPVSIGLGEGQTWHAVGRSMNVIYTNTEGRAIQVLVQLAVQSGNNHVNFYVNGVRMANCHNGSSTDNNCPLSLIIPAGATYYVTGTGVRTGINTWSELY